METPFQTIIYNQMLLKSNKKTLKWEVLEVLPTTTENKELESPNKKMMKMQDNKHKLKNLALKNTTPLLNLLLVLIKNLISLTVLLKLNYKN